MQLGSIRSWLSFPSLAQEVQTKAVSGPRETFERTAAATDAPSPLLKLTNSVLSWAGVGDPIVPLREELATLGFDDPTAIVRQFLQQPDTYPETFERQVVTVSLIHI